VTSSYLFVPMPPTPNGRMHVGHGGGTYLRSDVAARALRVRGASVAVVSGTDAFENWVLAEAKRIGRTPDETCAIYHRGIADDLAALGIEIDVWLDPRSPEHADRYRAVHERALRALQATGAAVPVDERIPFSQTTGQELVGTWVAGGCPHCGADAGGSTCTRCGEHFQPEELVDVRSRLDDSPVRWETREHWFAVPTDATALRADLDASGMRSHVVEPADRYLRSRGGRIRLTGQGTWGVRSPLAPADGVLANGYYLYAVYCGEVFAEAAAVSNPFVADTGVVTVGFFGSDNTTPGLVAPRVLAQGSGGTLRPFDRTVVNGMLAFEGQKCSTSKRHGIWLGELLDGSGVTPDELRFCLAAMPLDEGVADLSLSVLVERTNRLRAWVADALLPAVRESAGVAVRWDDTIAKALDEQERELDLHRMDLPGALGVVERWMDAPTLPTTAWLLGFALLAEPFLPVLARQVWEWLGHDGAPSTQEARSRATRVRPGLAVPAVPAVPVTEASLAAFVHRAGG